MVRECDKINSGMPDFKCDMRRAGNSLEKGLHNRMPCLVAMVKNSLSRMGCFFRKRQRAIRISVEQHAVFIDQQLPDKLRSLLYQEIHCRRITESSTCFQNICF